MKRKIEKFPLRSPNCKIKMPEGARILCTAFDKECESLCVFAEVDPDELDTEERTFFIISEKGQEFDINDTIYINTYTTPISGYVWHIYERFDGNYDL